MRGKTGFTLVELILVMAIIAILSVIGIGAFTQATLKSRDTQRKNDLNQMAKAIELFNNDMGRYPNSIDGVMQCPTSVIGSEEPCLKNDRISAYIKGIEAIYLDKMPVDPKNNQFFYYETDTVGNTFALYAALENNEDRDVVVDSSNVKTTWDPICSSSGTEIKCNYKLTETGLVRVK